MITRPASRPHICLSCQRRLAWQSSPSAYQAVSQSTTSSSRDHKPVEKPPQQVRRTLVPLAQFTQPNLRAYRRYRPVEQKLGDFYGFRGHSLVNERESLNHNNLGDPAEVIVLRESKVHRYDDRNTLEDKHAEHIDILAKVKDERGLIDQDEVNKNLNDFRPTKDEGPKSWDEFNGLVRRLQDSFTVPQLESYIGSFLSKEPRKTLKIVDSTPLSDESILKRGPWVPEFTDFEEQNTNESLRGYALASHTAKQRVVVRLLRECWKLEVPELEDSIGSMKIQIHATDQKLLSRHMVLDAMKKDFLPRYGEDLESITDGVIRITASRRKCDLVISQLELALGNIKRLKLDLLDLMPSWDEKKVERRQKDRWIDANFTTESLLELSRLTDTEISHIHHKAVAGDNKPKKEITISCLTSIRDQWLSNRAALARRLLVTSGDFSRRHNYRLGCKMPESIPAEGGIFAKHTLIEGLPWRDRLRQWNRWTLPIAKEGSLSKSSTDDTNNSVREQESEANIRYQREKKKKIPVRKSSKEASGSTETPDFYWKDKYETTSSAIFGNVLHALPMDHSENPLPKTPFEVDRTIRTFSTALPHLSSVLKDTELQGSVPKESLILHFQPNPFFKEYKSTRTYGAAALSAFPPIEMRFHVDSTTKALELIAVHAVLREEGTDLMLPDHAIDVRFYQKTTSQLQSQWLDSKTIKDFLSASNLTYEGRRLDLPPTISLPIAAHLCSDPALVKLLKDPEADFHNVEYLFVGREAKRTLLFQFEDWRLAYTHIDSGRTGGRKNELQLRPIRSQEDGTQEMFVDSVYNLAESFGTGIIASSAVRRITARDNLTRMFVVNKESAKPVPRVFTHTAKRTELMNRLLSEGEWWSRVEDGKNADIDNERSAGDRVGGDGVTSQRDGQVEDLNANGSKNETSAEHSTEDFEPEAEREKS